MDLQLVGSGTGGPRSEEDRARGDKPRREPRPDSPERSREPEVDPTAWPLLGRQDLLRRAARTIRGNTLHPGLVLMGPVGSGHSRVLQAVGADAGAAGFNVVPVYAPKVKSTIPFGPLIPLVTNGAASPTGSFHTALWNAVRGDPDGSPTVVLVDGLDFLDEASSAFLQQIVRNGVCVVGTCRAGACSCARMTSSGFGVETIPRLTDEDVGALVQIGLGGHVETSTADEFVARSNGLPRLTASLLLGSLASGALQCCRDGWHLIAPMAATPADAALSASIMSGVRPEAAALAHVVSSLGTLPVGLVRRRHEPALVEAEGRGILAASHEGVALAHPFDAFGIGGARGPIRRVAKALERDLGLTGLDRLESLRMKARLRLVADDLSDPLLLLIGARASLLSNDPGSASRLAGAASRVTAEAGHAMCAVAAMHEGADPEDAAELVRRELEVACDREVDLVAQAALAYLDTGVCAPATWLDLAMAPRFRGMRAEVLVQWERIEDARSVSDTHPAGPGSTALLARGVRAHIAAASGHVGDVWTCVESVRALTDPMHAPLILPSPAAAIRLGLATGLAAYLSAAPTPSSPGSGWWSSLVDHAADASAELLRGHPESARTHLHALENTPCLPGSLGWSVQAGCDALHATTPERLSGSRQRTWWEGRARYVALATQGDRVAAMDAARELAGQLEAVPAHLLVTLHDRIRLGDCEACHGLVQLVDRHAALGRLPLARAMATHARGLIAGDPATVTAAGHEFERLDAVDLAIEATSQADPRRLAVRPFGSSTLAHVHAPRTEACPCWCRLTPREREVAGLASEGMANCQIAAQLGISCRTVENQLSRAYAKLAISSRSELADVLADAPIDLPPGRLAGR